MPVAKLNCPSCGAPLEPVTGIASCPYCNSTVHIFLDEANKTPIISLFGIDLSEDGAEVKDPARKLISGDEARQMAGQIGSLCREGQRIEAIKMYRGRTGQGILASSQAVEELASDPSSPDLVEKLRIGMTPGGLKEQLTAEYITGYVRGLVQDGYKFEAVRWFSDIMGVSSGVAKKAVEAIMGQESFR
jgi:uncharacterized Zn finger protein (UPF0148 family)